MIKAKKPILISLLFIFISLTQFVLQGYSFRWDITKNKRYSLSEESIHFIEQIKQPLKIDVFLGSNLPTEYIRLREEVLIFLKNAKTENDFIDFELIDPFEESQNSEEVISELGRYGITPEFSIQKKEQALEQTVFFPWLLMNYENKTVHVSLLKKALGIEPEQQVNQSINQLEQQFLDGLFRLLNTTKKKIAIITSHKTSKEALITDLLRSIKPYYNIASFDLDAFPKNPQKTLENLARFDLLFMSNPKEKFSEDEKFILDQYTMQGGKSLLAINPVEIAKDSLFSISGKAISYSNNLGLDDLFFKYGVRLQQELIQDAYCAPIVLASGRNEESNYIPYPWVYYPLVVPNVNNSIGKAINSVVLRFPSPMDTLKNKLKKIILLKSSPLSKRKPVLSLVSLDIVKKKFNESNFENKSSPFGVLLEGEFSSLYENKIVPFKKKKTLKKGMSKIIIFSSGSIAENQLNKGIPLTLGYDKWTNNFYENKQFIKNSIFYLMDDLSLLSLQSKKTALPFLDTQKIISSKNTWKYFGVLFPLLLLLIIGIVLNSMRKLRYKE